MNPHTSTSTDQTNLNRWTERKDGRNVFSIDRGTLHQNMLEGFAKGLREGIPVDLLDGYRAFTDMSSMLVVNDRQLQKESLEVELQKARSRARNARRAVAEETDSDVRADYQEDARQETKRMKQLENELARMNEQKQGSLPKEFEGEVEFLLHGLSALFAAPKSRVPSEVASALRTVLKDLTLELKDNYVHWSASLIVPADGQVLILGPFSGKVPFLGRHLSQAEEDDLLEAGRSSIRRRQLRKQLVDIGYSKNLAQTITLAPGGYLVRALLGEEVTWPDCESSFDHEKFNSYLRKEYERQPSWNPQIYNQTCGDRQLLADLVAALGGRSSFAQLKPIFIDLNIPPSKLYYLSSEKSYPLREGRNAFPSVRRIGIWSKARGTISGELANWLCPQCQQPATAVVRVIEVSGGILCRQCRLMPGNLDIEFPSYYLKLALPPTKLDRSLIAKSIRDFQNE